MKSEKANKAKEHLNKIYEDQLDLIDRLVEFRHIFPAMTRIDVGIVAVVDLMSKSHAWHAAYIHAYKDAIDGLHGETVVDMINAAKSNGGDIASAITQTLYDEAERRSPSLFTEMSQAAHQYKSIRDEEIMNHASRLIARWMEDK